MKPKFRPGIVITFISNNQHYIIIGYQNNPFARFETAYTLGNFNGSLDIKSYKRIAWETLKSAENPEIYRINKDQAVLLLLREVLNE